jgi:hypothetical protein
VTDRTHEGARDEIDFAALYEPVVRRVWLNRTLPPPPKCSDLQSNEFKNGRHAYHTKARGRAHER